MIAPRRRRARTVAITGRLCALLNHANRLLCRRLGELETHLACPITRDLMTDPVIASDGHAYEREAIQSYLDQFQGKPTSPVTKEQMREFARMCRSAATYACERHASPSLDSHRAPCALAAVCCAVTRQAQMLVPNLTLKGLIENYRVWTNQPNDADNH